MQAALEQAQIPVGNVLVCSALENGPVKLHLTCNYQQHKGAFFTSPLCWHDPKLTRAGWGVIVFTPDGPIVFYVALISNEIMIGR